MRQGYELVERNYRTRYGELDLILRHENTLVFAEVKLRRGVGFGDPLEAVTPRKQSVIRTLAEQYLAEREPDFDTVRFDVVGILVSKGAPTVVHVEDEVSKENSEDSSAIHRVALLEEQEP
jgi:putative endonuclease